MKLLKPVSLSAEEEDERGEDGTCSKQACVHTYGKEEEEEFPIPVSRETSIFARKKKKKKKYYDCSNYRTISQLYLLPPLALQLCHLLLLLLHWFDEIGIPEETHQRRRRRIKKIQLLNLLKKSSQTDSQRKEEKRMKFIFFRF